MPRNVVDSSDSETSESDSDDSALSIAEPEENVVLIKPARSFAQAIGLRLRTDSGDHGNIVKPKKLEAPQRRFGGLNSLWQSAATREQVARDFVFGKPNTSRCEHCNAFLMDGEHKLCCGAKTPGTQVVKNLNWPLLSEEYRQTARELREHDNEFTRSCISVNRYFATAKLVVDTVAPEHGDSVYKPHRGGWNLRQAGNVVLAGRSFVMPMKGNKFHTPAVQVDTAHRGAAALDHYDFRVITLYRAIVDEQQSFFESPDFQGYRKLPGDFPPTTKIRPDPDANRRPRENYNVQFHPDATDVTQMREAVALSTVRSTHHVAPHVSVPRLPATSLLRSMLKPLDHADPHVYPLMLPFGIGGYSQRTRWDGHQDGCGKPILLQDFVKRLLYQRFEDFLMFPRISEMFCLDQTNRVAAHNIDKIIKVERVFQQYMRRVARMNDFRATRGYRNLGRYWQIPKSIPGSPAYVKKKLDDGMALIAKYGDPTFFITMTTNKNWPEIQTMLDKNGIPKDPAEAHPIITVRAFRRRLKALEHALKSGYIFGGGIDYLQRCVEFQKRGLSHAHIIVRLKGEQPLCSAEVDKYVSARLFYSEWCPDSLPRTDPNCQCFAHKLTRLVSKFMVHKCMVGVCKKTKDCPCSKRFPFQPSDVNYIDEDSGRWHYKRAEEDAYVVPYNISLLYFFQCHLNVDCSTGPGSGRYIRKYQCKMADSTMIRLDNLDSGYATIHGDGTQQHEFDEAIRNNIAAAALRKELQEWFRVRVLSSSEAVTRLLDCTIHRLYPAVKVVYIHLPGDHTVTIVDEQDEDNENPDKTPDSVSVTGSMLLRYFQRPIGPDFDNLTIIDYYSKYDLQTYDKKQNLRRTYDQGLQNAPYNLRKCCPVPVKKRPSESCAYIVSVQPSKAELYCLRQLLVTTPARSYDDLKGGFDSFQKAAVARGLYYDDKEYQIALQSCINGDMPNRDWEQMHAERTLAIPKATSYRVLNLFVSLITTCDDKQPSTGDGSSRQSTIKTLFNLFWPYLLRNLPSVPEPASPESSPFDNDARRCDALRCLAEKLHPLRIDLHDIGLENPPLGRPQLASVWENSILDRERRRFDKEALRRDEMLMQRTLNPEQSSWISEVYDSIVNASSDGNRCNVFYLGGNAGCGKSTAIKALLTKIRLGNAIALPCAYMASAASIMPGADTLHRLFKLPVEVDRETDKNEPMQSTMKSHTSTFVLLKYAKLIVIDEISMVSRRILDCVDKTLQQVRNSTLPFGGVCVVLAGDFKQLTPVIRGATRLETVENSVTSMDVFHISRKTVFRRQMRVKDAEWNRLSLATGYGVTGYSACQSCSEDLHELCSECGGLRFLPDDADPLHEAAAILRQVNGEDIDFESSIKDGFFSVDVPTLRKRHLLPRTCKLTTSVKQAHDFAGPDGFIIAPLNDDVMAHNSKFIPQDPTCVTDLRAVNTQNRAGADDRKRQGSFRELSQEIMDAYNGHGVPPSILSLWVGARVTLLRNLNPSIGLYNGQNLIVRSISRFLIQVTIADIAGKYDSNVVHDIPRVTLSATVCSQKMSRKQFPIKLAYAMTVNRSQGQTILPPRRVVIDARRDYFSHGHLYVALTRVQQASQVMLLLDPDNLCLSSVVYQSILEHSDDTCFGAVFRSHTVEPAIDEFVPVLGDYTEYPDDAVDASSDCDVTPFGDPSLIYCL